MFLYQHDNVRACHTCPNCLQPKDRGLVLCWPCHRQQKNHNDGSYSKKVEAKIAYADAFLGAQLENTVRPI